MARGGDRNDSYDWKTAEKFTIDTTRSIRKSIVIYGQSGCVAWPVAYISRPKWITQTDFDSFIDALEIRVRGVVGDSGKEPK